MEIQLHNLPRSKQNTKKRKRIGRGNASGQGTYAGRGLKGQRSRSGGKGGLKRMGLKRNMLNLPKFKGMKSKRPNNQGVSLELVSKHFTDGDTITPETLADKKLVASASLPVKILATGELSIKVTVVDCKASKAAQAAIEKAGGSVTMKESPKAAKKDSDSSKGDKK